MKSVAKSSTSLHSVSTRAKTCTTMNSCKARQQLHTIADTSEACQSNWDYSKSLSTQISSFLEYEDEPKLGVVSHSRASS